MESGAWDGRNGETQENGETEEDAGGDEAAESRGQRLPPRRDERDRRLVQLLQALG